MAYTITAYKAGKTLKWTSGGWKNKREAMEGFRHLRKTSPAWKYATLETIKRKPKRRATGFASPMFGRW